jgi:hypothetical protein
VIVAQPLHSAPQRRRVPPDTRHDLVVDGRKPHPSRARPLTGPFPEPTRGPDNVSHYSNRPAFARDSARSAAAAFTSSAFACARSAPHTSPRALRGEVNAILRHSVPVEIYAVAAQVIPVLLFAMVFESRTLVDKGLGGAAPAAAPLP